MSDETKLYRHFDKDGVLLYVGISLSAINRLSQHREHSHWFAQIATVKIETFVSRSDALMAERQAITKEKPKHNIRHKAKIEEEKKLSLAHYSRQLLERKIVGFNPLYTVTQAANALGFSNTRVHNLIKSGEMGYVLDHTLKDPLRKPYITGWQLIEYLEHLQHKAKNGNPTSTALR